MPGPSKSCTRTPAELVTYSSTVPFVEARARLEAYINRKASIEQNVALRIRRASSAEELTRLIEGVTQLGDFIFFQDFEHSTFLNILSDHQVPPSVGYTFGNPLIARLILERDLSAAAYIPPRILLRQHRYQGHSSGKPLTTLQYHRPSTLLPKAHLDRDPELRKQLEGLDAKIEKMVLDVLSEDETYRVRARL
ncbi:hypothetical protein NMY22_g15145 [Coprinellus aureogranulatus]|nr:hypothetical protein NMY22_g15145 [Coprinellus aureogranulatus]